MVTVSNSAGSAQSAPDLLTVTDTSAPANPCGILGDYLGTDLAAVVVYNMKAVDTSFVDSFGVWCGSSAGDSNPDFSIGGGAKWYNLQTVLPQFSASGRDSIIFENAQFYTGTVKTIWCAVVLKNKAGKTSTVVKMSFPVGVNRPANPVALQAASQTASTITLSWPPVTGIDMIRILYQSGSAIPLNNASLDTLQYRVVTPPQRLQPLP